MLIGIVTSGIPFNGDTLKQRAIGGSETAVICMARNLAKLGNQVKVFCNCDRQGVYDGVEYIDRSQFGQHASITSFDVLIASRWVQYLAMPSMAGLRVLWCHDILTDPAGVIPGLWQSDLVMLLSDYHIENYCGREDDAASQEGKVPHLRPFVWKTSNGLDMDVIQANKRSKVPNKLIYTSRPERGLDILLGEIMPRLLEKNPKLSLARCTYDLQGAMQVAPEVQYIHDTCERLAEKLGRHVINLGSLTKEGLYQQISSSQAMVYPTAFPEIFCISAIEAQALGTPIITTDNFACRETCGPGSILIPGRNSSEEYINAFVDATLKLLQDKEDYAQRQEAGIKFVAEKEYDWAKIAQKWNDKFLGMLTERWGANKSKVVKELARQGDIVPAALLAEKHGLPEAEEYNKLATTMPVKCVPDADLLAGYNRNSKIWEAAVGLLQGVSVAPKTILEYKSSNVSFGLAMKRLRPETKVVVWAADAEIAGSLKLQASESQTDIEIVTSAPTGKFDLVYVGDRFCESRDPQGLMEQVSKQHTTDSGVVVFTAKFMGQGPKFVGVEDRLWNMDVNDLKAVLEGSKFALSFTDVRALPTDPPKGVWVGLVQSAKKPKNVDIGAKAVRTRPYQDLSVCLIGKNEEEWLLGALKSVKNIADEIILVDTGSTDKTVEIAEAFGAKVITTEFEDFAIARNKYMDAATGDWILWFDCDERIVNAEQLRKYLASTMFEGYAIKQNHLMIDGKSFDLPIRVLRNRPQYRFVGCIHEHCEDLSRGPYDEEIRPTLSLDEVDIAHYGYLNEAARRWKCSFRNMELLQKDVLENGNKGRMLTWVLVMRDYINMIKWTFAYNGGRLRPGGFEHVLLNAVVSTFLKYFGNSKHKYYVLAEQVYQDALMLMGRNGLCYPGFEYPPFQADIGIAGAVGGMKEDATVKPNRKWFLSDSEFVKHLHDKSVELVTKLGISDPREWKEALAYMPDEPADEPDAIALLQSGTYSASARTL